MARRKPLRKSEQGRELCHRYKNGTKICVRGAKYGFIGKFYGKGGAGPLPAPTGAARTAETALKNAKRFLSRAGKR